MPTIVFYFVVLSQLLRLGETAAAGELADALTNGEVEKERDPLLIPRGATVSDDAWRVSTPARVGDECRLHGNLRAQSIVLGTDNNIFGSLRARSDIAVGEGTQIHGDVTTRNGTVTIADGARVLGDVSCTDLELHEDAVVDGALRARGEMHIAREDVSRPAE